MMIPYRISTVTSAIWGLTECLTALGPHEVKPHIARGTLLILYAIIILIDDDTMLTREKSDDTATHSFKSIIYVHAFQLDTGN